MSSYLPRASNRELLQKHGGAQATSVNLVEHDCLLLLARCTCRPRVLSVACSHLPWGLQQLLPSVTCLPQDVTVKGGVRLEENNLLQEIEYVFSLHCLICLLDRFQRLTELFGNHICCGVLAQVCTRRFRIFWKVFIKVAGEGVHDRALTPYPFIRGSPGAEVPLCKCIIGNVMVYHDRSETNLLQPFAHPETSEWFSIISGIIFEVNIVDEQKQA